MSELHHYMMPPAPGQDRGPSACGNPGTTVLFRKNVTCPGCKAIVNARIASLAQESWS